MSLKSSEINNCSWIISTVSIDERVMPREGGSASQEMDIGCVGNQALSERQASWKQPLAEAATKTDTLTDSAAHLYQLGWDENALWLKTNEWPECAPLDDMEFRIKARVRLDLPVTQQGLCQHQRRQKPDVHSVFTHILRADLLEFLFHCSNSSQTYLIHEKFWPRSEYCLCSQTKILISTPYLPCK